MALFSNRLYVLLLSDRYNPMSFITGIESNLAARQFRLKLLYPYVPPEGFKMRNGLILHKIIM